MTRSKLALIAILLIAVVPVLALAAPGDGPGERGRFGRGFGPGHDGPRGPFLPPPGYLDLTDEQIDAAGLIRDGLRDEMGALRDQHRALRDELDAALDSDSPDAATVGQLVIDLHAQRPQFRSLLESAEAEFAALLDDEQLPKWENWKELRQSRRGERGERRRHRERRGFGPGPDGPGPDGPGPDGPPGGPGFDG